MKKGSKNANTQGGNYAKARQAERNDRRESRGFASSSYDEEDLLGNAAFEVTHLKAVIVPSPDPLKGNDLEEEEQEEQEQPGEEGAPIAQGEEEREREDPEELRRMLKNLDQEAEVLAAANKAKHEENERLRLQNEEQAAQLEEAKRTIAEMQKQKEPAPEPKAEQAPAQEQKPAKEAKKPANPEDALQKAQNLLRIGERLKSMKTKHSELEGYIFGNSQTGEGMTLKDANGKTFTTNNVALIKKVKDLVLGEIATAVEQAEAEIMELA